MAKKSVQPTIKQLEEEKLRIEEALAAAKLKEEDHSEEIPVKKDKKDDKKSDKKDDDKDDVKEAIKANLAARLESYMEGEQPAVVSGADPLTGKTRTTSKDSWTGNAEGNETHVVNGGDAGGSAQTISPKLSSPLTSEDAVAIFGDAISEEGVKKARIIFEAAVKRAVLAESKLIKEAALKLVEETVDESYDAILEQVDEYVSYLGNEWMTENKLAADSSLQLEIHESFFAAIKDAFLEHNIVIPEGKTDSLESKSKEVDALTKKLNEATQKLIDAEKKIFEGKKKEIVAELSEGLVATHVEKLKTLVEGVEAKDEASFREKAKTIKESYFKDATVAPTAPKAPDGAKVITETTHSSVNKYVESLKQINNPK